MRHALGETDDHTWVFVPEREVLCPGDLFVWVSPNAGNPQKVQRYPAEWAAALREMASAQADQLLPSHGPPIVGAERVREALTCTAAYLESLVEQTLALMNAGARLDEIIHTVRPPADLAAKPYLQPVCTATSTVTPTDVGERGRRRLRLGRTNESAAAVGS